MAADAEQLAAQAERLRELKKFSRQTYKNISEAIDVTERQVQRWFAGDGDIGPKNRKRLAAYLDTTEDYIEYGVMQRPRLPTPEPLADRTGQLDQIEAKLDWIIAALAEGSAKQLEVVLAQGISQEAARTSRLDDTRVADAVASSRRVRKR